MSKKIDKLAAELLNRTSEVLVHDPDTPWVLTSTTPSGFTRARVITGLIRSQDALGRVRVTPLTLDPAGTTDYLVSYYRKSVDDNTGKILFSSNGTRFEVRALRLEDSSWLFPGRQFADLAELIAAVTPS